MTNINQKKDAPKLLVLPNPNLNLNIDLNALLIHIIVNLIIITPVLWLAGRGVVGKEKAKFTDAIFIVLMGTVIGTFIGAYLSGWIAIIAMIVSWLLLVRHFFDCGWLKALAITILAVIIFIIIAVILALIIGFAIIAFIL